MKSFKRFLSTILTLTLLCSCIAVMNVTAFAADTSYTYTATYIAEAEIPAKTSLTFTDTDSNKGDDYITAQTGPAVSSVPSIQSAYGFSGIIPLRANSTFSDGTKVTDFTSNAYSDYTYIILNPLATGTFSASIGMDAKSSTKSIYLFDNTDAKNVVTLKAESAGKIAYSFGGTPITNVTYSGTAVDTTTGEITLSEGHQYILYTSGTGAQLGSMTFTPTATSTDPTISALSSNETEIDIDAETTVTATLKNMDNVTSYSIAWSIDNDSIATVTGSGNNTATATVKGVAEGTATITATLTADDVTYNSKDIEIEVYDSTATRATITDSAFLHGFSETSYSSGDFLDNNRYFELYTLSSSTAPKSTSPSVTSYGNISYSTVLSSGSKNANIQFTTSDAALVQIVFASNGDSGSRSCYIGKDTTTANAIGSATSTSRTDLKVITCSLSDAGKYYVYCDQTIQFFSINVIVGATLTDDASNSSNIGAYVNGDDSYVLVAVSDDEATGSCDTLTLSSTAVSDFDSTDTVYAYVGVDNFVFAPEDVADDTDEDSGEYVYTYIYGTHLTNSDSDAATNITTKVSKSITSSANTEAAEEE
ncbi:MAG: Ig-like domain-containing protein [Eubacterium sp.]|nr:Ig-like domain-containing protein [Eubacterium sp.]